MSIWQKEKIKREKKDMFKLCCVPILKYVLYGDI